MADIQKCNGGDKTGQCSVALDCYRYTAKASEWQSYGPPASDFDPKDGCDN